MAKPYKCTRCGAAIVPGMRCAHSVRLGILVARAIISGDLSRARLLANENPWHGSWSVPEARAIAGAVRAANKRWHCANLNVRDFFGGAS